MKSNLPPKPFHPEHNPRFIWVVGAIREEFSDIPADLPLCLWDRQEARPVVTLEEPYCQLMCLEKLPHAPFTALEMWLNRLSNGDLESEGLPITLTP